MVDPVIVEVETKKSLEAAFKFFTAHMHKFWPQSHSLGEAQRTDLIVEMRPNGRWYEVCGDKEYHWGRVISFEENKEILFAWHLNAEWVFDPDVFTEVLVEFEQNATGGTTVTLTHRHLERYGDQTDRVRQALSAATGWPDIIGAFAKLA